MEIICSSAKVITLLSQITDMNGCYLMTIQKRWKSIERLRWLFHQKRFHNPIQLVDALIPSHVESIIPRLRFAAAHTTIEAEVRNQRRQHYRDSFRKVTEDSCSYCRVHHRRHQRAKRPGFGRYCARVDYCDGDAYSRGKGKSPRRYILNK